MGISVIGSSYKLSCTYEETKVSPVDPNPARFKILKTRQYSKKVVVLLEYPNCTNFEGNKILVFEDTTIKEIVNMKEIDPHFHESSKLIARFRPTKVGWDMAKKFAKNL